MGTQLVLVTAARASNHAVEEATSMRCKMEERPRRNVEEATSMRCKMEEKAKRNVEEATSMRCKMEERPRKNDEKCACRGRMGSQMSICANDLNWQPYGTKQTK